MAVSGPTLSSGFRPQAIEISVVHRRQNIDVLRPCAVQDLFDSVRRKRPANTHSEIRN